MSMRLSKMSLMRPRQTTFRKWKKCCIKSFENKAHFGAYTKKEITNNIGKLNTSNNFISDYDFFIRIGLKYEFFISNKILSSHRIHINNTQHKYFQSGKGYLEYANLYFHYLFNKSFSAGNRLSILNRLFLYLFYWIARKLLNIKFIKLIYNRIKIIFK